MSIKSILVISLLAIILIISGCTQTSGENQTTTTQSTVGVSDNIYETSGIAAIAANPESYVGQNVDMQGYVYKWTDDTWVWFPQDKPVFWTVMEDNTHFPIRPYLDDEVKGGSYHSIFQFKGTIKSIIMCVCEIKRNDIEDEWHDQYSGDVILEETCLAYNDEVATADYRCKEGTEEPFYHIEVTEPMNIVLGDTTSIR